MISGSELHTDFQGTPRVITAASSATVEGRQTFGPFGEAMPGLNAGYVPLTGYTGHIQTEAHGLIYMKGRFYSPAWHRFLNSDQGVDPNSPNEFAYCGGSPFTAKDPSGLIQTPRPENARGTLLADSDSTSGWWIGGFWAPTWVMGDPVIFDTVKGYDGSTVLSPANQTVPGDAFSNPKFLGDKLISWDDTIQGKSFTQVGDYTVVTDMDGNITNSWVGAISAVGFEFSAETASFTPAYGNESWWQLTKANYSKCGILPNAGAVVSQFVGPVSAANGAVVASQYGAFTSSAGALTTFLDFAGASTATAVGSQASEALAIMALLAGAYDAGAFAGSMATAAGQKLGDALP